LVSLSVLGWRDTIEKLGIGHVESAGAKKLVQVEMTHSKQAYSQVSTDVLASIPSRALILSFGNKTNH
jgi:hypothetical protein